MKSQKSYTGVKLLFPSQPRVPFHCHSAGELHWTLGLSIIPWVAVTFFLKWCQSRFQNKRKLKLIPCRRGLIFIFYLFFFLFCSKALASPKNFNSLYASEGACVLSLPGQCSPMQNLQLCLCQRALQREPDQERQRDRGRERKKRRDFRTFHHSAWKAFVEGRCGGRVAGFGGLAASFLFNFVATSSKGMGDIVSCSARMDSERQRGRPRLLISAALP